MASSRIQDRYRLVLEGEFLLVRSSLLYLVPDLLNRASGIARYGRMVCLALATDGWGLRVVSLMDRVEERGSVIPAFADLDYVPCEGSRYEFLHRALLATLQWRPEIILAGHPNLAPFGFLLARLAGADLVTLIYGIDAFGSLSAPRRWALQRSDRILSISHFTARRAIEVNGVPPDRVRVLHNCLDPWFEEPIPLQQDRADLSMLTVARLSQAEQYKGHDFVIRAMPALLERFPQLVYNVVGDGDWRPALEALAGQMGVERAVRFHGHVSEEDLRGHYVRASLFIMPSRAEGFGFVFLEAMAHGLPVVAGNADATSEVVVDGETGYLVDPTSVRAIVTAVSRLLGDRDLRLLMGSAGRRRVRDNFGYKGFRMQLLGLLEELAGEAAPRPL
jgi:phosphatidylinositol alpha-1,6-mannosyltransferase